MSELSLKKIVAVTKTEYIKWICNGRMFLVLMLLVFMKECVVDLLMERSMKMDSPLNFIEPFLAVGNSGIMVLILPVVYLTLMSDFPKVDGNTVLLLPRVGKYNWFLGQLLFAIISFHTFLLVVLLGSIIMIAGRAFVYNGWSLVITEYETYFPQEAGSFASDLLPENLYNQLPPIEAALYTYIFLGAYMLVLVLIMMLFQIWKKKMFGFFSGGALITLGAAFCAINTKMKWLFPMAHALVWVHYSDYYRKMEMPIIYSGIYFIVWIIVLGSTCFLSLKKMNFDTIQEVD